MIEDDAQSKEIIPANSVTELSLNHIIVGDEQGYFLKYIASKYPNIQSLTFDAAEFMTEVMDFIPDIEGVVCCRFLYL
jgi:hypothetical protein